MYTVPLYRIRFRPIVLGPEPSARPPFASRMPALKPLDRPPASPTRCTRRCASISAVTSSCPAAAPGAALAMQLGVSRTPVREALARLESDGLVAAEGRSFIVPVLSDADVDEIYEVPGLLEPAALAQVAESVAEPRTLAGSPGAARGRNGRPESRRRGIHRGERALSRRVARSGRQSPVAARDRAQCRLRPLPARC